MQIGTHLPWILVAGYSSNMTIDPAFLTAVGDVFLNLSAGWFGAAIIIPITKPREQHQNHFFVGTNIFLGVTALVLGYKLRILGI